MIPRPLVLGFGVQDIRRVRPDADYVMEQYRSRRRSVYETTTERILRGLMAEDVLARHRGVARANVRRPQATPHDVAPDIEVRAVARPGRVDFWSDIALVLYPKDRPHIDRRWVLAMVDMVGMEVRYLGWETGRVLLTGGAKTRSRDGRDYVIAGMLWPDQLRGMDDLT